MGRAYLPAEMKAAIICREFGWTYKEYRAQPQWFVSNILMMLHAEAEEANRKAKA